MKRRVRDRTFDEELTDYEDGYRPGGKSWGWATAADSSLSTDEKLAEVLRRVARAQSFLHCDATRFYISEWEVQCAARGLADAVALLTRAVEEMRAS